MTCLVLPESWLYCVYGFRSADTDAARVAVLPKKEDSVFVHSMVAMPSVALRNHARDFRPLYSTKGFSVSHLSLKSSSTKTFLSIATDFYVLKVIDFFKGTAVHDFLYYGRKLKYNNHVDNGQDTISEDPVSCTEMDFCGDSLRVLGGTFSGTVLLWDSFQSSPLPTETLLSDPKKSGVESWDSKKMVVGLKTEGSCVAVATRRNVILCDRRAKAKEARTIADAGSFYAKGACISCFDWSKDCSPGSFAIGGDCGEIMIVDERKGGIKKTLNLQNRLSKAIGAVTDVRIFDNEVVASTMYRGGFRAPLNLNTVENFFYDPFYRTSSIFSKSGVVCIKG